MPTKITVIGAGSVGAAITNDIMVQGIASEILLIDINKQKAFGEALDIYQGAPFCSPAIVRSGDYEDAADSDIVIITSGVPRKPGQTRLELAQTNVNILKQITPQIVKYAPEAIYILVSNPVDILTYVFHKISGLPEHQIIGSGTVLDKTGIRWNSDYQEVEEFVKTSGAQVIKAKGATFYAVAMSVCHICKVLLSGAGTAVTVSTMMHGEYGVDDVCLSTLNLVGKRGIQQKIISPLTEEETAKLQASAAKLKEIIASLEI